MADLVRRFVLQSYPTASAAVLAGSRARGTSTASSDYDVIVLFPTLKDGAWREVVLFEDERFEVFVHDLGTLAYFCREVDRPSGIPILPNMVVEGISILPLPSAVLDKAREIAQRTLSEGPPPLDAATIANRRYVITDMAAALQAGRDRGTLLALGAALYTSLADFTLRAEGRWSARGKALPLGARRQISVSSLGVRSGLRGALCFWRCSAGSGAGGRHTCAAWRSLARRISADRASGVEGYCARSSDCPARPPPRGLVDFRPSFL